MLFSLDILTLILGGRVKGPRFSGGYFAQDNSMLVGSWDVSKSPTMDCLIPIILRKLFAFNNVVHEGGATTVIIFSLRSNRGFFCYTFVLKMP